MTLTYLDGLNDARRIVLDYRGYDDGALASAHDICDDIVLLIDKKMRGSVAQMATQRPAKTSAGATTSAVGSNPTATANLNLFGKNIVFTGALIRMNRSDAFDRTLRAGANPQNRMTQSTDYLVVAHARGSVKWNAAVALGVPILSEDEWYRATV